MTDIKLRVTRIIDLDLVRDSYENGRQIETDSSNAGAIKIKLLLSDVTGDA